MAETVDYYFYTWNENGYYPHMVMPRDIEIYFGNRLKKYQIVDTSEVLSKNKICRLSYLAKKAQSAKKQVEEDEGFVYDYVIETRPDLYLGHHHPDHIEYATLKPDEILIDGALTASDFAIQQWTKWSPKDGIDMFRMGHWYVRMTSDTYDRFSDRFDFFNDRPVPSMNFHRIMGFYFIENTQFKLSNSVDPCICWPVVVSMQLDKLPDFWDGFSGSADAERLLNGH